MYACLMGAGILDKAMELYPALDFESYDRTFPNQDSHASRRIWKFNSITLTKARRER